MKIGLLGYGTVGSGVDHILQSSNIQQSKRFTSKPHVIKRLVRDVKQYEEKYATVSFTDQVDDFFGDEQVDVLIEVMGGVVFAREVILRALTSGQHVITANKAVVSKHLDAFIDVAKSHQTSISIEACVGGGMPVISTLVDHFMTGEIEKIDGILNGTGNFILTKMSEDNWTFEQALSEAQRLGYAEAIPDDDVDGIDAARKLIILAALSTGKLFAESAFPILSIRSIKPVDIKQVKQHGGVIKYVVSMQINDQDVSLIARPVIVPLLSALGQTNGVDNVMVTHQRNLGEVVIKGAGAGSLPTANAVVSELNRLERGNPLSFITVSKASQKCDLREGTYYVRMNSEHDGAIVKAGYELIRNNGVKLVKTKDPVALYQSLKQIDPEVFVAEWAL